jgi:hypothetical protein
MKRTLPNPGLVYPFVRQPGGPVVPYQPSLPSLPLEIIKNIFEFLSVEDTCRTLQTYRDLYYPARIDNPFWQKFFLRHFSFPRVAPQGSWLNECEMQHRSMYNIIAGRCAVNEFKTNDTITCFARDEKDRFIIGFGNGKITISNPKTNQQDLLTLGEIDSTGFPQKIVCHGGLCAVQYEKSVCVWDLEIKEMAHSFQAQEEKFGDKIAKVDFADGRLLVEIALKLPIFSKDISDDEPTSLIKIFDLKSKEDPIVWSLKFSPLAMALNGNAFAAAFPGALNYDRGGGDEDEPDTIRTWNLKSGASLSRMLIGKSNLRPVVGSTEIHFFSEKELFWVTSRTDVFMLHSEKAFKEKNYFLWESSAIPFKFQWGEDDSLPCSTKELSSLFSNCIPKQFALWNHTGGAPFKSFLPQEASVRGPLTFEQRKLSFLDKEHTAIFSLDFTASKGELLGQIVTLLEAGDETSTEYARHFFLRMPEAVQRAIWDIYDQTFCSDGASSQEEEERPPTDLEYLKEAIISYTFSIS